MQGLCSIRLQNARAVPAVLLEKESERNDDGEGLRLPKSSLFLSHFSGSEFCALGKTPWIRHSVTTFGNIRIRNNSLQKGEILGRFIA